MFGYINVNKPELKVREFDRYRSYYCGLCHSLKDRYGISSRLALSYDVTFLVILFTSLYEPITKQSSERCPAHPALRHTELKNIYTDYGADMNLLCTYYIAQDNKLDAGTLRESVYGKGLSLLYHNAFKKLRIKYPAKVEAMEKAIKELHLLEAENSSDLDAVCHQSGLIVRELFAPEDELSKDDVFKEDLLQIGYHLGRFIYLMDAWEDIEKDIKSGSYNPLIPLRKDRSQEEFDQTCFSFMTMIMGECAKVYEGLPLIKDVGILNNIIYSGVFTRRDYLLLKRKEESSSDKKNVIIDD